METTKAIIVTGDPIEGLSFIGPFDDNYDAIDYAEKWIKTEWWIGKMFKDVGDFLNR